MKKNKSYLIYVFMFLLFGLWAKNVLGDHKNPSYIKSTTDVFAFAESADVTIQRDINNNFSLTWAENASYCGYEVYESDVPYFTPGDPTTNLLTPQPLSSTTTHYLLPFVPDNHYYIVRALSCSDSTVSDSNTVGKFYFNLQGGMLLETTPYMEYEVYNGAIVDDPDPLPVLSGGWGDYSYLFDKYDLCDLAANGEIDEVWIWAGNGDGVTLGHLLEWTTSGPGWSGETPDCGEVLTTMVYNYTLDVNLHTYGHRMEGLMRHHQPCDFSTRTWPWNAEADGSGDFDDCDGLLSNEYGFVARPFPENNHVAGCGDVHFPPNMTQQDNRDYIYNESRTEQSICSDWSMDGSAQQAPINCQAWGCTHYGYQIWWLQNFPGLNNINRDRQGNFQPNWWDYLFGGSLAPSSVLTPTAASSTHPPLLPSGQESPAVTPHIATSPESYSSNQREAALSQVNSIVDNKTVTAQEAIIKPVVFVVNLTAYIPNGAPIDDVDTMNTQIIAAAKEATTYHGYSNNLYLQSTFEGQDGQSFAGQGCTTGDVTDNVHIHLAGLKTNVEPVGFQIEDDDGGVWATPCDPASNWMLFVNFPVSDQADLYFKPFRDAPAGTEYIITVDYSDGSSQVITIVGSEVTTLAATFIGQDGESYAGQGCSIGTVSDNVHIHLVGLKTNVNPVSYQVDDLAEGGVWADPCDPLSNWMLFVTSPSSSQAELYFKPFRDAPDGTVYTITVEYDDGSSQVTTVIGSHISP